MKFALIALLTLTLLLSGCSDSKQNRLGFSNGPGGYVFFHNEPYSAYGAEVKNVGKKLGVLDHSENIKLKEVYEIPGVDYHQKMAGKMGSSVTWS